MGADISGWVEIRESGSTGWDSAIQIHDIVFRSYAMFASLFGVRNGGPAGVAHESGHFRAIAPGRGAPPGASRWYVEERDAYGEGAAVGETWVLWGELAAIDWDEEGEYYFVDEDHHVYDVPLPGTRRERRGDYLTGGWATLFKLMAVLAEQFGADNVRLSVWFDMW